MTVLDRKPANTAILLEQYRNHPHEKVVKELASLNLLASAQNVEVEGVEKEFVGALNKLLSQANSASVDKLLAKGEALSTAEKDLLRKLLSLKQAGAF